MVQTMGKYIVGLDFGLASKLVFERARGSAAALWSQQEVLMLHTWASSKPNSSNC